MKTTHYIGRTADDNERVFITIERRAINAATVTTNHERIVGPIERVSITGQAVWPRERHAYSAGQIRERLDHISKPAPGWTMADVTALANVWDTAHLNDMSAGCAHQPAESVAYRQGPYGRDIDLDATPVCPETGYQYGSAWLYRPITDDERATLARLQSLPTGDVPSYIY